MTAILDQVPHLWEAIQQMSMWVSFLISTRVIAKDRVEAIFEFNRSLLEKVGYRMSMDAVLIFLVSTKIGQIVADGMEFSQVNLTLSDLYIKPLGHHPLKSFWVPENPSQTAQLQATKQTLQEIAQMQVGSLIVLALLHEMQLVVEDVASAKP